MKIDLIRKQERFNLSRRKREASDVYYWTAMSLILASLWVLVLL